MASDAFTKRFQQLVKNLSDTELGYVLGVSADAARKMRHGDIKSLKLKTALRLARELGVTPWYIACEAEPETPPPPAPTKRAASKDAAPPDATPSLRPAPQSAEITPITVEQFTRFQDEVRTELREMRTELRTALRDLKDAFAK